METNSTTDCNGYANYKTWNVALWIQSDEGLYNLARSTKGYANYKEFCGMLYPKTQTPDGVYWLDDELDFDALDEMIRELSSI